MTSNGRLAALAIAGAMVLGGMTLTAFEGEGWPLILMAAVVFIGTLFDGGYRGRRRAANGQWQRTGEREVDHQTGEIVEVWYDPVSGERRYERAGQDPS